MNSDMERKTLTAYFSECAAAHHITLGNEKGKHGRLKIAKGEILGENCRQTACIICSKIGTNW